MIEAIEPKCFAHRHMSFTDYAVFLVVTAWAYQKSAKVKGTLFFDGLRISNEFSDGCKGTIYKFRDRMVTAGWLIPMDPVVIDPTTGLKIAKRNKRNGKLSSERYRVLKHEEWAAAHPGACELCRAVQYDEKPIHLEEGMDGTESSSPNPDVSPVAPVEQPLGAQTSPQPVPVTITLEKHMKQSATATEEVKPPFRLTVYEPYSTFIDGKPAPIPFVVSGLLPCGTLCLLGGKPKMGKSSVARYLAKAVSQGSEFLGRKTMRGESLIISLEDSLGHTDNHLKMLQWNQETDERIQIATKIGSSVDESLDAIEAFVNDNKNLRLVIIDTLPKVLKVKDGNDYSEVSKIADRLHKIAKDNVHVAFLGLLHCKKSTNSTDVFDGMLGSTAWRAEGSTNIVLHEDKGRRYIAAETRVGRAIPSTELEARLVQMDIDMEADYCIDYKLGGKLEDTQQEIAAKSEQRSKETLEGRMLGVIQTQGSATHKELMAVKGNTQKKVDVIKQLVADGIFLESGEKGSQQNPQTYSLSQGVGTDLYMMGKTIIGVEEPEESEAA
jgi:hypothetical protein